MEWIKVGCAQDLGDEEAKPISVAGFGLALFRLGDDFFATEGICSHGKAMLSEGFIEDGCIECPLHQGRFDIRSGKALCAPATVDLRTFAVKRDGDDLYVQAPAAR